MLPIEPRLKPLGATILHYADGETKTEFKRCHSYSGYIPYDLNDADAKSDASVEDAYEDVTTVVWPGTDEEHEVPSQSFNTDQVSVPQPASIGEKVIMGFGRALRKAVRDTCTLAQLILVDAEPLRPWIPKLTWTNSCGAFTKRQVLHRCASFMPSFIFAGCQNRRWKNLAPAQFIDFC
eukprot:symbB.v1.2.035020.t1/scaffold4631.1/size61316/3